MYIFFPTKDGECFALSQLRVKNQEVEIFFLEFLGHSGDQLLSVFIYYTACVNISILF